MSEQLLHTATIVVRTLTSLRWPTMVLKQCCVSKSHHFTKLSLELNTYARPLVTLELQRLMINEPRFIRLRCLYYFSFLVMLECDVNCLLICRDQIRGMLPCDQEVFVLKEQGLRDDVFMALQPVQATLIDDVPHDHICVLAREGNVINTKSRTPLCKKCTEVWKQAPLPFCFVFFILFFFFTLEPVTSRAPSESYFITLTADLWPLKETLLSPFSRLKILTAPSS